MNKIKKAKKQKIEKKRYYCDNCQIEPKCVMWEWELGVSGSIVKCGEIIAGKEKDLGRCSNVLTEI